MEMLQHKTTNKNLIEDYDIIFSLPEPNAMEVMQDVFEYFVEKIDLLSNKSFKFVKEMFRKFQMRYYFDNETVFNKGDVAEYLYFIAYGKLSLNEDLLNKYEMTLDGMFKIIQSAKSLGFEDYFINK